MGETFQTTRSLFIDYLAENIKNSEMRFFIILAFCLVAAFSSPLPEDVDDIHEQLAMLDTEGYLEQFPVSDDEETSFAKRTIDDQTLEELLLAKMEFVFKLLGPLAPKPVKDAIRKIVNERKAEIVQIVKQGGGALIKLLIQIWRNALLGGLLG